MQSGTQSGTPVQPSATSGRNFTIIGFILAVVSLFILPIPFGIAGAVFGGIGYSKGDKLGMWALIASIAAIVINLAVLAAILNNN